MSDILKSENTTQRNPFIEFGYEERLTDGLNLFLNPYSRNPISDELISNFIKVGVNVHTFDINKMEPIVIFAHGDSLFQRYAIRLRGL